MLNNEEITKAIDIVNEDTEYLEKIVSDIVQEYTADLDDIMQSIVNEIISVESPAINTIEKYFMKLSSALYFMCERSERLGIFDSISKSKAQETYNQKYLEHQTSTSGKVGAKKPTVAESQAVSENAALYDKTVNDMYNKVYKIVKNKISAAETMVSTLSKILSHRIQESQLTSMQTGRQILNEGKEVF